MHLFLALNDVMPEQVAKSGLDYFFAVRDALFRKSAEQPDLVNYVGGLTGLLPNRAFSIVRESKLDLLAFLGSQQIDANMFGIEYLGVEVMLYKEAFLLVADISQGVRKLRERVAIGRERFDKAVAESEAVGRR
ncbi:MAG: hypothetical protein J0H31_03850 [Alphaproteobacteria bacterium]|nr:hypothetical protein [Alphaproteobacteria bacterium]